MIDVLRPYTEHQDSEVSWLGKIPAHWEQAHGGAVLQKKKVRNRGMVENTVLSLSYGRIVIKPPEKLHGLVPESFETYQIIDPGDIIIRPIDLQNDWNTIRIGIAKDRGIITSAYLCFRARGPLTPEYAHLLLLGYDLRKVFYGMGSGLRQNLDWSDFKRLPVLIPPREEQQAIVWYIAWLDRQVRRFVRNRGRLIEVLNEQEQAIINQAVTRGPDPNAPLKPSGIDWLGEIPERWEVKRLRNVAKTRFSNVDKHSYPNELPVRLCNYTDVYRNKEIASDLPFMKATVTPSELLVFGLRVGDVIITKDSEDWLDIGVPAVVVSLSDDLVCGYHLAVLRPYANEINGAFLSNALQSVSAKAQLSLSAKGVTRYGLSQGSIKGLRLPVPPHEEQVQIARHIKTETRALEAAIFRAQGEINLIREYRSRLIADVVTGKVDVRHLAPPPGSEDAEEMVEDFGPLNDAAGKLDEEALAGEVAHVDD